MKKTQKILAALLLAAVAAGQGFAETPPDAVADQPAVTVSLADLLANPKAYVDQHLIIRDAVVMSRLPGQPNTYGLRDAKLNRQGFLILPDDLVQAGLKNKTVYTLSHVRLYLDHQISYVACLSTFSADLQ